MKFELMRISEIEHYIDREDSIIVDLRTREEFRQGHIRNSVNIPYQQGDDIAPYVEGFDKIFLYCQRGSISLLAARDMSRIYGTVYNLCGGIQAYRGILIRM